MSLAVQGNRILVGDIQESVHFVSYQAHDNKLIVFADDTTPRCLTAMTMVDYDTVAGGDKFGNFFIVRLQESISRETDDDPTGTRIAFEQGFLQGAAHKVSSRFHIVIFSG